MNPPPSQRTGGRGQRFQEGLDDPPGRSGCLTDERRARLHPPTFPCLMVLHSGRAEGDPPYPARIRGNTGWEWGRGRRGGGRPGLDRPESDLKVSRLGIRVRLMGDGRVDREGIGLRHHSCGGSRICGWRSRPVTLA